MLIGIVEGLLKTEFVDLNSITKSSQIVDALCMVLQSRNRTVFSDC